MLTSFYFVEIYDYPIFGSEFDKGRRPKKGLERDKS